MSETQHTGGPWFASQPAMGFSEIRQQSTGKLVFALAHPSTKHGDGEISDEEKYANLALLAAASDMYDALKCITGMLTHEQGLCGSFACARCHAERAIAKAESRA